MMSALSAFGEVFDPQEAAEPILARPVRAALMEWLTEIWAENELIQVGVHPRRRAIFDGPPGVGKTTLAHHLAARLGLRMLAVRPDKIVDKYVGQTGRNIGQMFEAVADQDDPVVLFLDEFDSYGHSRRRATQGAEDERNNSINTLLQRLEQHKGFLIAATNFGEQIDQAIWRRFDIHIGLQLPGQEEREKILARYLEPFAVRAEPLTDLAFAFESASPALMRHFCENLKRALIVGPKLKLDMTRDAVIGRLLATVKPHPDLASPRLWQRGPADIAIQQLPWPLQTSRNLARAA